MNDRGKTSTLSFKVTTEELQLIRGAAQLAGLSVSGWGASKIAGSITTLATVNGVGADIEAMRARQITDKMRDKLSSIIIRETDDRLLVDRAEFLKCTKSKFIQSHLIREAERMHDGIHKGTAVVIARARTKIRDLEAVVATTTSIVVPIPRSLTAPSLAAVVEASRAMLASIDMGSWPDRIAAREVVRGKAIRNLDKLETVAMTDHNYQLDLEQRDAFVRISAMLALDMDSIGTLVAMKAIRGSAGATPAQIGDAASGAPEAIRLDSSDRTRSRTTTDKKVETAVRYGMSDDKLLELVTSVEAMPEPAKAPRAAPKPARTEPKVERLLPVPQGGHVKDADGNVATLARYGSEVDAKLALQRMAEGGNKGCTDCTDCEGCTDCTDCRNCKRCHQCVDCFGLKDAEYQEHRDARYE